MMSIARLALIISALLTIAGDLVTALALGLAATAQDSPKTPPHDVAPNDVAGRVVDKAGAGVADVQVWAIRDDFLDAVTIATATTDGQGRFSLTLAPEHKAAMESGQVRLGVVARARDGRIGWRSDLGRVGAGRLQVVIPLGPVGDARGRLTDQNNRPIGGVTVGPILISRATGQNSSIDIALSPEPAALLRTTTAADGSFVLKGIPDGPRIHATIAAPAFGTPTVSWNPRHEATITLDGRLARIKGRLEVPATRGLPHGSSIGLSWAGHPRRSARRSYYGLLCYRNVSADKDGTFRFDDLPPGLYMVSANFDEAVMTRDGLIATDFRNLIEVGPGGIEWVAIPLQEVPMMTGRVVDSLSGKGIAGVGLHSLLVMEGMNANRLVGEAMTDVEGWYKIPARPGRILIECTQVPNTHFGIEDAKYPRREVKGDQKWPEFKLPPATVVDGIVLNQAGRPVAGAEVYLLDVEKRGIPGRSEMIRTGAQGTFHLDPFHPDDWLSLWARAGDMTTDGVVVLRPQDLKGRLTLRIDPKSAVRIRGQAIDEAGKAVAGARVTLRWNRQYPGENDAGMRGAVGSAIDFATTGDDGSFVFRGLWTGLMYDIVIEAAGHGKAEVTELIDTGGETRDLGKIVLDSLN